jgi:hypothetical protein
MVLSTVRIPIQRIHPTIQHQLKDVQRTTPRRRPVNWRRFLWYPILLFTFMLAPRTYAIPGINHIIVSGESSLDQARQHAYVNTIVDAAAVSNSPNMDNIITTTIDGVTPPEPNVGLRYLPYCFIADTDSVEYIIDTGANRIIINNRKLFVKSQTIASSVKGIAGNAVKATAVGDIRVPLKSRRRCER